VGRVSPLIKPAAVTIAAAASLIAFCLWWDEQFVRAFQRTEQLTIRPEPRFRPSQDSKAGCCARSTWAGDKPEGFELTFSDVS
jgi:hypothetical protein